MQSTMAGRRQDYSLGLNQFGILADDIARISQGLEVGQLPRDIIDLVILQETEVLKIHPDRYPWSAEDFDILAAGLIGRKVDVKAVWRDAKTYVEGKFVRGMPGICGIRGESDMDHAQALTNLFGLYALAKYHDTKTLPSSPTIRQSFFVRRNNTMIKPRS